MDGGQDVYKTMWSDAIDSTHPLTLPGLNNLVFNEVCVLPDLCSTIVNYTSIFTYKIKASDLHMHFGYTPVRDLRFVGTFMVFECELF